MSYGRLIEHLETLDTWKHLTLEKGKNPPRLKADRACMEATILKGNRLCWFEPKSLFILALQFES